MSKIRVDFVKNYLDWLEEDGAQSLYTKAIGLAEVVDAKNADINLLDQSEYCFKESRKNNDLRYFKIGQILRKAAHALYFSMIKNNKNKPKNNRFLNLVA